MSGLLSIIQITRFHIYKTPYFIGTGLISVVGISFAIIPVAQGAFKQMYLNGFCETIDGQPQPCPQGYGALIGTAAVCALLEISHLLPAPVGHAAHLPPIVTGPTVSLIGVSLIQSAFQNWAGGSGLCSAPNPLPPFALCPDITAPHALAWGSAEYLGLGFSVFVTIILCERFGSPIMKSTSVVIGLLTGCIIAAACGYFDRSGHRLGPGRVLHLGPHLPADRVRAPGAAHAGRLHHLRLRGHRRCDGDVRRQPHRGRGRIYESRIQGGVLADGLNGILAALMTITPMTTFAQNNGVIALTRCANRRAGYCCW